jgi:hypothetical protein
MDEYQDGRVGGGLAQRLVIEYWQARTIFGEEHEFDERRAIELQRPAKRGFLVELLLSDSRRTDESKLDQFTSHSTPRQNILTVMNVGCRLSVIC